MSFFRNFSLRWYDFESYSNNKKQLITNILHSISIKSYGSYSFDVYRIDDLDTLYSISTDKYGHPDYWWIIAIYNNMFLSENQWPYTQNEFEEWIDKKYRNIQPRERIKFYEKSNGTPTTIESLRLFYQLDSDKWTDLMIIQKFNILAISIYEWEKRENEKRKYIKIPKKEHIEEIDRIFKEKMMEVAKQYS
jgi:tRNA A37 threonylcarbamoyladenosine biosynthesis protein TsaE